MKPVFQSIVWKMGAVKIMQIVEIEAGEVIQAILPQATPANIKKIGWLCPHFADENGNLKAVVQAFVIETPDTVIMVDTCIGNDKARKDPQNWGNLHTDFLTRLEQVGCAQSSIKYVLCTHLHYDHVGWNTMQVNGKWVPTFPKARYLFARQEFEYWLSKPQKEMEDDHAGFNDSVMPVYKAGLVDLIDTDHRITQEVSLIPTPGHTPAHVSVLIESEDEKAVITGDAAHHPCQMAHPSWSSTVDTDQQRAALSRHCLLERFAGTDTLMIGSHFSFPTAGKLVKDGDGFKLIV
jgi:glyoxylase-like metal-dependent hydrolase (beta-lactamase superfamily II)